MFYCISTCSLGSEALLCGSELNLFLARGLTHDCAMSVRWEPEHKITLLVSTARFVACQTKPVLCPRAWEATSSKPYVRSRVGAFVLAGHSTVLVHAWRHAQPTKKIHVASQPRGQSTGFAWDKPRSGLWTPGGDFVFEFSMHTHRTIVSQTPQWGTEPAQIRRGVRRCLKNTLKQDEIQWTNQQNSTIL